MAPTAGFEPCASGPKCDVLWPALYLSRYYRSFQSFTRLPYPTYLLSWPVGRLTRSTVLWLPIALLPPQPSVYYLRFPISFVFDVSPQNLSYVELGRQWARLDTPNRLIYHRTPFCLLRTISSQAHRRKCLRLPQPITRYERREGRREFQKRRSSDNSKREPLSAHGAIFFNARSGGNVQNN
jgi:hypothetical protein